VSEGMNRKRRIGLKYCGGCNPTHDRVATAASIGKRLEDRIALVSYADPNTEGTLVVTGCPTACVDLTPFDGRPVWVVTGPADAEGFVKRMRDGS